MTTFSKIPTTFDEIFSRPSAWQLPQKGKLVRTIEMHTGGEPLRVIVSGFPTLKGGNILEARQDALENWDQYRKMLMWEPRGHADMYGCVLTPPMSEEADFGVFFLHNEGYSTMCGHAVIALCTLAVKMGLVKVSEPLCPVTMDTPAGLVKGFVRIEKGEVLNAYFHNVPSFVVALDQQVQVSGLGTVTYDLAFGGAFYAYVQAEPLGIGLQKHDYRTLIEKGSAIKKAVMESSDKIVHPYEEDLSFLYGTIFIGPSENEGVHSRNVCIFAEGEVDRSPTGTGVSGRVAIHHARKEIGLEEPLVIESIIGSQFIASVRETTRFGPYPAVVPQVEGKAWISGTSTFYLDPRDPFPEGFFLR